MSKSTRSSKMIISNNKILLWLTTVSLTIIVCLISIEIFSGFLSPPWPNRDLRTSGPLLHTSRENKSVLRYYGWFSGPNNSWGMRDLEREVKKPVDKTRIVFVGDSFLEGGFAHYPLSLLVEKKLFLSGNKSVEVVNLGVSATDPKDYYYRIRNVALKLDPDLLVVTLFSGNDFIQESHAKNFVVTGEASILKSIMPRFNWVIESILRSWRSQPGHPDPIAEFNNLFEASRAPYREGVSAIAENAYKYYSNGRLSKPELVELFGRGGVSVWESSRGSVIEPEVIQGWIINNMLSWELGNWPVPDSTAAAEAMLPPDDIIPTTRWIESMRKLAEQNEVPIFFVLIPTGVTDPRFMSYQKNWPRYASWNYTSDARHLRLAKYMEKNNFNFLDLRPVLMGISGTYRLSDQHWTDLGHELVSDQLLKSFEANDTPLKKQK